LNISEKSDTQFVFYKEAWRLTQIPRQMLLPDHPVNLGRKPPSRRVRPAEELLLAVLALEAQLEVIQAKQARIDAKLEQLQAAADAATVLLADVHDNS
jgi:hypothetical protein